jgi:serine/threonine protein phosphatase PrpC
MKVQFAGQTDVGLKRTHNEDSFLLLADHNLYMVADGMGGHSAGEVASRLAVETIAQFFRDSADDEDVTWPYKFDKGHTYEENRLATGVKLANLRIHESASSNSKQRGMGTTLVSTRFVRDGIVIGHVGDSRVYRVRDRKLEQLTEDHSLLNDYIKMKELTPEEIENFPHKNVIVRALGMKDTVQVDVVTTKPQIGDIYMLCSDGLCGMIDDAKILEVILQHETNLEAGCNALIEAANANGGADNITAVLLRVI